MREITLAGAKGKYDHLTANRHEYGPGKLDIAVRDATRKTVGRWIEILGSAGKAQTDTQCRLVGTGSCLFRGLAATYKTLGVNNEED